MSVTVQPEGMSGVVDDGLAYDADEQIIIVSVKKEYCVSFNRYHENLVKYFFSFSF